MGAKENNKNAKKMDGIAKKANKNNEIAIELMDHGKAKQYIEKFKTPLI